MLFKGCICRNNKSNLIIDINSNLKKCSVELIRHKRYYDALKMNGAFYQNDKSADGYIVYPECSLYKSKSDLKFKGKFIHEKTGLIFSKKSHVIKSNAKTLYERAESIVLNNNIPLIMIYDRVRDIKFLLYNSEEIK